MTDISTLAVRAPKSWWGKALGAITVPILVIPGVLIGTASLLAVPFTDFKLVGWEMYTSTNTYKAKEGHIILNKPPTFNTVGQGSYKVIK